MPSTNPQSAPQWTIRPGFAKELPERLPCSPDECRADPNALLIRDNNVRMSFFYRSGGGEFFVKQYKCRSAWDRLKYFFFPSKASAEWNNLLRFAEKGIPTAVPIAMAERRTMGWLRGGCLITGSLAPAEALGEFLAKTRLTARQRQQLGRSLGRLVRRLHDAGVFFRDLHAGNILIRWDAGQLPELFLIDLHKAFFVPALPDWMRVRDLGQLGNSLKGSRADAIRFLRVYCKGATRARYRGLQLKIRRKQLALETVRVKSRSKRCIKHSSVFENKRTLSQAYFGRKDFGLTAAEAAIRLHESDLAAGSARLLKQASKSAVTVHALEGHGQVCVKGYTDRGPWHSLINFFRRSRALKSWIAANGLLVRGIDTPLPLAVLERTRGPLILKSFLVTRFAPSARELNSYVQQHPWGGDKRGFIAELARFLRLMHERGVYHGDLKSNNILVQEQAGGWRFSLIDLDRVHFKDPGFSRRLNNLAQINSSVDSRMSARDRLFFFRIYAKETALFAQRKTWYRKILAISRAKNTAPYGVVFQ